MNDESIETLIARLIEEPADEQTLAALSLRLEANPVDRQYYFDYCQLHADLVYLASADGAESRALDAVANVAFRPSESGSTTPAAADPTDSNLWRRGLIAIAAVAASVAIVFAWQRHGGDGCIVALRQPTIVGSLTSGKDAIWDGEEYRDGAEFRVGSELRLKSGLAKIGTPTGAEIVIEGPCDLVLNAPENVLLRRGKLTARVAEWSAAFAVETPSLKVVDLGKQFAVAVDEAGNAEAHALQGDVRIQPLAKQDASRTSFLLAEGQAIRVNSITKTTTQLHADERRFVRSLGEFQPFRPLEINNTGRGLTVGDEDQHWRIVAGAVGEGYHGPQYAVVCEPDARYIANHPLVSQWLSVSKDLRPGCLPNSVYTFRTTVDLSGYDLSTVRILADMLADNGVAAVRINGQPVELTPWRDNVYMQEFDRFRRAEIVRGFVAGKNTIEIDVVNGIYQADPQIKASEATPNPMAFRVEWQAFGQPLPEAPRSDDVI